MPISWDKYFMTYFLEYSPRGSIQKGITNWCPKTDSKAIVKSDSPLASTTISPFPCYTASRMRLWIRCRSLWRSCTSSCGCRAVPVWCICLCVAAEVVRSRPWTLEIRLPRRQDLLHLRCLHHPSVRMYSEACRNSRTAAWKKRKKGLFIRTLSPLDILFRGIRI